MAKLHVLTALMLSLLLAACAGSTSTFQPISSPETSSIPTSTVTPRVAPTSTSRSATAMPGSSPTVTLPQLTPEPTAAGAPAWTERSDVANGPSAREDHTWTVNDDYSTAYLFGGRGAAGAVLGDLWQFDLQTDTWSELHPSGDTPSARFGHTATWVRHLGLVVWSGQGARFFDDMWRYDPDANVWAELPSLGDVPEARYGSCASLGADGALWISHGFTADDGRFADTRSYDFSASTWTDRTPSAGDVPVSRCLHDCFWSSPDELVLYGGQTTGVTALGDVWVFNRTNQTWIERPVHDVPARNLYAMAAHEGSQTLTALVFGGGAEDGSFLGDIWGLNAEGLQAPASALATSPSARSSATLISDVFGQRYLLFGGMNGDGVLNDLWELSSNT